MHLSLISLFMFKKVYPCFPRSLLRRPGTKQEKQMRASELLILTLKQGWIARMSLCKEQIFSWFQSGEWGCEEQSEERPTSDEDLGGHHPRTTSSWTRLLWSSSSCSLQFPGGRRCPCSKWRHFLIFTYIYLCAMDWRQTMLYQFLGRVEEENDSKWKMGNWRSVSLGVVELKDEGGEGRSAKRKRGHPWGVEIFTTPLWPSLSLFLANCWRK